MWDLVWNLNLPASVNNLVIITNQLIILLRFCDIQLILCCFHCSSNSVWHNADLQLKRLELKLKQFAEVETLLLKESEQVERARQNLTAQRVRFLSARFASTGGSSSTMASNPMNQASPRPPAMPGSRPPASMQAFYANNLQGHPAQMAFLQQQQRQQQQQQMLSFGPRLPLSAIHPGSSSSSAPSVMFNPGMPNSATPNHHSTLRPPSGNNSSFS